MSATIMVHGPFTSGARLVKSSRKDFVSFDITGPGISVSLIAVTDETLDSLTEAVAVARAALSVPASTS